MNNAGRSMRGKLLDTTPEQFRELMELNLIALVRCTRAAVPHLLAQRGHVVNIGSLAAKSAARWVGAYPATKYRRGRLFAAVAAGTGAARAARVAGVSRPDRAQGRPALPAGRAGGRAGAGAAAGGGVEDPAHPAPAACPGDPAGVPAPPAGVGGSRHGPLAVRPGPALAPPGRLDRAEEDVTKWEAGRRRGEGAGAVSLRVALHPSAFIPSSFPLPLSPLRPICHDGGYATPTDHPAQEPRHDRFP